MFFTPRYVKEARHVCEASRRLIRYRFDLLKPAQIEEVESRIELLAQAARDRDAEAVKSRTADLEKIVGKVVPPRSNPGWRENCEVFLVAIVIAAGVRAYLLEPFKIPTGSMQPTLNGVIGYPTAGPFPNPLVRAFEFAALGRTYIDVSANRDDVVLGVKEQSKLNYFTWSTVYCASGATYTIFAPASVIENNFGVHGPDPADGQGATRLREKQPIVHGYVDNGDFVLVNKLAYNFFPPKRGDVFVFRTTDITGIENQPNFPKDLGSQHYIKRIAGTPGDTLRVDQPRLFINGQLATERGFARVMTEKDGYNGYTNPSPLSRASYLTSPKKTFTVPAGFYFAMGDNSRSSFDSRYWGLVPEKNVTGKAFVAFWPLTKHWGFID